MNSQIGIVIEREVQVGPATFLIIVMRFGDINSYLVLDTDGQTVENKPFMVYIDSMIEELDTRKNFR